MNRLAKRLTHRSRGSGLAETLIAVVVVAVVIVGMISAGTISRLAAQHSQRARARAMADTIAELAASIPLSEDFTSPKEKMEERVPAPYIITVDRTDSAVKNVSAEITVIVKHIDSQSDVLATVKREVSAYDSFNVGEMPLQ